MSCGVTADDLESTYLGALETASGYTIAGTDLAVSTTMGITLEYSTSSGPVEPAETPAVASPGPSPEPSLAPTSPEPSGSVVAGDIVGSWKMTDYAGSALPAGMLAIDITFAADGTFAGSGGCNDYSGEWSLDGTRLSISGFTPATTETCDQITLGLEQGYFGLVPFLDTAEVGADGTLRVASSFAPQQGFVFERTD
jgi:hypothetical protein